MKQTTAQMEVKWQEAWESSQCFAAKNKDPRPKFYALDMFPYPSGVGLHLGHIASYTPADIVARYKRTRGFNVLHPMGFDAFGLPAEQYAIQTGVHPAVTTKKAIETFRRQLRSFGFSFDWTREISTCEPNYYKWTQFIFSKLFERGLAYQKEVPVNWCPALKTVLANEEVIDGRSERGGHPVIRMPMKQWMLKITSYAERLLTDLDKIDWPERTKEGQRNWIGKSEGATVQFKVANHPEPLSIFTTRPDTLFGVTFMVLAPEHPFLQKITPPEHLANVNKYVEASLAKSEIERKAATSKSGVFTGAFAIHPLSQKKIPIWVSDYVLMDYGTGAIMAVPGHDLRDFEFAKSFGLPILRVLTSDADLPFEGDGILMNSDFLNGLSKTEAITQTIKHLEKNSLGTKVIQYKLRDWLFSRQRYWGEPFPIVHFDKTGTKALPIDELPVGLPEVADYQPSEKGEAPLARNKEWVEYSRGGQAGTRETDTMPGSAGSSWYFLRFVDPSNDIAPFDFEAQKYWMPVDLYVGGAEHTVGHLLYARFWQKVLFDAGLVSHDEPFKKLAHQGMILGADGEKMSKSRGNVADLDEIRNKNGADALRTFISFMGPMDKDKPWSATGIDGVSRFLDRVRRLIVSESGDCLVTEQPVPNELNRALHKTIKKVTEDIESMSFNTAISALMILVNELSKADVRPRLALKPLVQMLMPFAPHLAEELWKIMEEKDFVSLAPWPNYDSSLVQDETITMGVQVNGKMRGTIQLTPNSPESIAVTEAQKIESIVAAIAGKSIVKIVYKAGKILNLLTN
jgi:leucyl-tRNA synthetase